MSRCISPISLFLISLTALSGSALRADEPYYVDDSLRHSIESRRYFNADASDAPEAASRRRWKKAWIASWIGFAAVTVLDAHSSRGKFESNPLLRNSDGRFSVGKAVGLKSAVGVGMFVLQQRTAKRAPHKNYYKGFTIATAAAAGTMGAVAARNYGVARPEPSR